MSHVSPHRCRNRLSREPALLEAGCGCSRRPTQSYDIGESDTLGVTSAPTSARGSTAWARAWAARAKSSFGERRGAALGGLPAVLVRLELEQCGLIGAPLFLHRAHRLVLHRRRHQAGIALLRVSRCRAAGVDLGGRREKFTRRQLETARKLIDAGEPASHVARGLGMSRATRYRRLADLCDGS